MPDPIEMVVRGAIDRQRLSNALARDQVVILRRAFEDITGQLARLDPTAVSGRYQKARLEKLRKQIAGILKKADAEQYALAKRELAKIGSHEGARAVALLGGGAAKAPIAPALFRELLVNEPIRGVLLRDWFKDATDATVKGVNQQIRIGVAEHETIGQIMRRVRGVEAPNVVPRTGEFAKASRRASAIARTAVNDISNKAARNVYQANSDLTKDFRYVATLDSRTTEICMGLDGQTFGYDDDDARYPPQHINCRSTIVPVLLDPIGKPGKRASIDGPVPADTNYEEWLRGKDAAFQDKVLGKQKAQMFRDGKISLRDLVRSDGTAKTVEELGGAAVPARFNSVADARKWFESEAIDVALPDLDLDTANQIAEALARTDPAVRGHINIIGTPETILRQLPDDVPDFVKRRIGGAVDAGAFAEARGKHIIINPKMATARQADAAFDTVRAGWNVRSGRGGMFDMVSHELGHMEETILSRAYPRWQAGLTPDQPAKTAMDLWVQALRGVSDDTITRDLSSYATANGSETWAELSVLRRAGLPIPDWAARALEKMTLSDDWAAMVAHNPWTG